MNWKNWLADLMKTGPLEPMPTAPVKKIEFVGKNILQRYFDREADKCRAEGHAIPEGEMCRRQYARNVLQELIDL